MLDAMYLWTLVCSMGIIRRCAIGSESPKWPKNNFKKFFFRPNLNVCKNHENFMFGHVKTVKNKARIDLI